MKIRKGDKVKITLGKDRGKEGKVEYVSGKDKKVFVGGANLYKRHVRKHQDMQGGIIDIPKPLDVSNVALICPNCKSDSLRQIVFHKTKVARCDQCQGLWFNRDELSKTVAEEDKFLEWLDIDLWKNKEGFKVVSCGKICPVCDKNLFRVDYNGSDIRVEICDSGHGVWLDKGEFKKIIGYLERKVDAESLGEYFKDSIKQAEEIFTGPKELFAEVKDFFIVNKLLEYKFLSQQPIFADIIANLPH